MGSFYYKRTAINWAIILRDLDVTLNIDYNVGGHGILNNDKSEEKGPNLIKKKHFYFTECEHIKMKIFCSNGNTMAG